MAAFVSAVEAPLAPGITPSRGHGGKEAAIDGPAKTRRYRLTLRGREAVLGERTWVMGVLNVTPDSFSDGGLYADSEAALAHGLSLFEQGADIVDVGGESTRPGGAQQVDAEQEIRRVVPVLDGLRARGAGVLSIDTTKAAVARAALDAGADMVNDVSGFTFDPALGSLVAERGVPAVVMHVRGDMTTMHRPQAYDDVMGEVIAELRTRLEASECYGVPRSRLFVDPGLGFAKNAAQNLELLRRLPEMSALECPVLVGPSRKSFIGKVLELPVGERLFGTAAAVAAAVLGGAHMVRVHDVREMVQVVRLSDAIRGERRP
jgi:dihydropteroate synthase